MCMPVIAKSQRPDHLAEAATWRAIHSLRMAAHMIDVTDRQHIYGKAGPCELDDLEDFLKDLTPRMLELIRTYNEIRESIRWWRSCDNAQGAKEYSI